MMSNPLVSIITVNYNTVSHTIELINSIIQCDYKNIEIIVVDNASSVDPTSRLKNVFGDKVIVLRSDRNLGFAGGNNLGINIAIGGYIFFVNNDIIVKKDTVITLLNRSIQNPKVGVFSPKIIFHNNSLIQYAGAVSINPFTGRGKKIGYKERDHSKYTESYITDLAHGAAMFVPRRVIEEVGLLPEVYFLYYEEHDWCEQIKTKGYDIMYVGETVVFHKESSSVKKISGLKYYYQNRNRILYMRRNVKGFTYILSLLFYIFVSFPKISIGSLANKDHIMMYLRAIIWNIKHNKSGESYFKTKKKTKRGY